MTFLQVYITTLIFAALGLYAYLYVAKTRPSEEEETRLRKLGFRSQKMKDVMDKGEGKALMGFRDSRALILRRFLQLLQEDMTVFLERSRLSFFVVPMVALWFATLGLLYLKTYLLPSRRDFEFLAGFQVRILRWI